MSQKKEREKNNIDEEKSKNVDDEVKKEVEKDSATNNSKEENNEEEKMEEVEHEEIEEDGEYKEAEQKEEETSFSEMERPDLIEYIDTLEKEIASLKDEKDKFYQKCQRLQADFVNYRKRTKREKASISLEARIELVNEILPVIDNFERALSSEGDENDFKTGVEMIYKQLLNNLKSQGLEKIPTEGEEFDHKYHEAIMQVDDCEEESGIIVEEMQKGYMIEDKVIRPAMVKVAK